MHIDRGGGEKIEDYKLLVRKRLLGIFLIP